MLLGGVFMAFALQGIPAPAGGIDWQTLLLAVIAAGPGIAAAYYAAQARGVARSAAELGGVNNKLITEVKVQTDGLAKAAEDRGFKAGDSAAKATVAADAITDLRQAQMIEGIVARLLASQTAQLAPVMPRPIPDPGPNTANQLTDIKDIVDDVQPRVVAIEDATVARDKAHEKVAKGTDDRLTKLEETAPKAEEPKKE